MLSYEYHQRYHTYNMHMINCLFVLCRFFVWFFFHDHRGIPTKSPLSTAQNHMTSRPFRSSKKLIRMQW